MCKFIKFLMPIANIASSRSGVFYCGRRKQQSIEFIHLQIQPYTCRCCRRVEGFHQYPWHSRYALCICRLLSIVCDGKRQLLLSVANRIASVHSLPLSLSRLMVEKHTTNDKHITEQMVVHCKFRCIMYRICQPTNSLFRKP